MRRAGFTLIELLVTIAVYGMLIIATVGVLRVLYTQVTQQPQTLAHIDSARSAEATFVNEIRDASIGVDGSYPIGQASTSQIVFFSPFGNSSGSAIRVRYFVSGTTLYKGTTYPSGVSYNLAKESVTPLVTDLQNGTSSVFLYYDGSFAGTTTPLAQPVNINSVTYVQMLLRVPLGEVRTATTTFLMTTGAAIRNLKTNLGN